MAKILITGASSGLGAASPIGDDARSVVVSGEGKGDLGAMGMACERAGKAESLRLLKETRPMPQKEPSSPVGA